MQLPIIDNCDGCGLCCMHVVVPPYSTDDRNGVPEHLLREIDQYIESVRYDDDDKPCMWLDLSTGRCRHYEHRPTACREFEMGSSECVAVRLKYDHGRGVR